MVWVKKTQLQHIYLAWNDKGRLGIIKCWKSPIYRKEEEKHRVSGTRPSVSVPSRSQYVIRICLRKVA